MAATRSDERQRQCCLDNVRIWSSGPATKSGGLVKNRHGGAPEGAPAGHTAGGTLKRCQTKTLRLTGAPLPPGGKEGNEGGAPRLTTSGADESRPYEEQADNAGKLPNRRDTSGLTHPSHGLTEILHLREFVTSASALLGRLHGRPRLRAR